MRELSISFKGEASEMLQGLQLQLSNEAVELRLSGEARCVGDVAAIGVGDRDSHQTHPSAI